MRVDGRPSGDAVGVAQRFLDRAALLRGQCESGRGSLRFGVDLGTATVVITAVDSEGEPVYWDFERTQVVRDGVVVDFAGAVTAVRLLKARAESVLSQAIDQAATAYPPAVPVSECRACGFVLEQAGIECRLLLDEVSAARALLGVRDGAIVDVGGGSTGVGVYRDGVLCSLTDQPGGGHHLDLILAGHLGVDVVAAEAHKREYGANVLQQLRPGVERIAESVRRQCGGIEPGVVHLAGGALQLPGADTIVQRYLGWPVQAYQHAELITPFGIALS